MNLDALNDGLADLVLDGRAPGWRCSSPGCRRRARRPRRRGGEAARRGDPRGAGRVRRRPGRAEAPTGRAGALSLARTPASPRRRPWGSRFVGRRGPAAGRPAWAGPAAGRRPGRGAPWGAPSGRRARRARCPGSKAPTSEVSSSDWLESSLAAAEDCSAEAAFCWVTLSISPERLGHLVERRSPAPGRRGDLGDQVGHLGRRRRRSRRAWRPHRGWRSTSPSPAWRTDSRMSASVLVAASLERSASERTSSATTAKPRPASPARAASTAALRARRLVWKAMSLMSRMICEVPSALRLDVLHGPLHLRHRGGALVGRGAGRLGQVVGLAGVLGRLAGHVGHHLRGSRWSR